MQKNKQRVTMREIGQKFGVTHATVSLALNNHPRISLDLRSKIQAKALEMGYKPDPMLTALAHYRHKKGQRRVQAAIAWFNCWKQPKDLRALGEFDAYWRGAFECAEKFGYRLEEFVIDKNMPLSRLEKILLTRNIKGILIPPHRDDTGLEKFDWKHFSAVRLGRSVSRPEMHIVTSDQAANTVLAFNKVRELGYERIGYVGKSLQNRMFTAGFMQAQLMQPKAMRLPLLLLEPNAPENQKLFEQWINTHKPQVVITEETKMQTKAAAGGFKVPEDFALVGLSMIDGNLSAGIDQHSTEVGRVAMLMVLSLINDFAQGIPAIFRQILVEGSWVAGPSCPPFKSV